MPPSPSSGVNDRMRDPVGIGLSLAVGALLGLALAAPMLPRSVPVVEVSLGPSGVRIFLTMLAVIAVPLCLFTAYLALAYVDR